MATDKDILTGALNHMAAFTTSLPIAWPGVNFTPPSEGMWFEVRHFPNTPNNLVMDNAGDQEFLGFLQVSVFDRPGAGIVKATEQAEGIIAHFPKGTALGPVMVRVRPYLSPPIPEDNSIQIPVTVPYKGIAG